VCCEASREDRLAQTITDACRRRIRVAIHLLSFLDACGASAVTATQGLLERYQEHVGRAINDEYAFVVWLRDSRINTRLSIPYVPRPAPMVTVPDEQRWAAVDRLLHDESLRRYTRIGGLLTLLFAQPLTRIVAMRTNQVTVADDTVHVCFSTLPIQMPAVLDDLIREHLDKRGKSLYASRDTGWLFPGGNPGRHLATENIRAQLVAIGIKPYEPQSHSLPARRRHPRARPGRTHRHHQRQRRRLGQTRRPRLDRLHRRPRPLTAAFSWAGLGLTCGSAATTISLCL